MLAFPILVKSPQHFAELLVTVAGSLAPESEYISFKALADEGKVSPATIGRRVKEKHLKTVWGSEGKMIRTKDKFKVL